ncbi:unnamed protein product [Owenia fusiformis]|uniref:Uncharacterized protein n=1 Tax=Owenia fusiformis TaxID=6347 RepID=A0A8S4NMY5_OWEFU|nr:unnamed protein product [Owenia fusiformis]
MGNEQGKASSSDKNGAEEKKERKGSMRFKKLSRKDSTKKAKSDIGQDSSAKSDNNSNVKLKSKESSPVNEFKRKNSNQAKPVKEVKVPPAKENAKASLAKPDDKPPVAKVDSKPKPENKVTAQVEVEEKPTPSKVATNSPAAKVEPKSVEVSESIAADAKPSPVKKEENHTAQEEKCAVKEASQSEVNMHIKPSSVLDEAKQVPAKLETKQPKIENKLKYDKDTVLEQKTIKDTFSSKLDSQVSQTKDSDERTVRATFENPAE